MKITPRQAEIMVYLKECGALRSGSEGSIFRALKRKGLVLQHFNRGGGNSIYYTWTLSRDGREFLETRP